MNRVVITGIGVVSPVGCTLTDFWSALVEARPGVGPITIVPTDRLNARLAAEVSGFDTAANFKDKRAAIIDRYAQFAVVAARAAVADSGLSLDPSLMNQTATIIGTAAGGQATVDAAYLRLYGENISKMHPLTIPRYMLSAAASHISMDFGLRGPAYAVTSACASGTHAIGQGFHLLRSGQAPVAIVGGSDACLTVGTIKLWEAMRVMSNDACRPFSKTRSGFVLGEGAAVLVLETRDHALARGARVYAEVRGFGMSADAVDVVSSDPEGAARAMRAALADAQVNPDDIQYVNAHGTATALNDRTETTALRSVFGASADRLSVSSSKGVLGHSLGAAGAFEIAATALALHNQTIPPTANFEEPDPECDLDVVPNVARRASIQNAMSNSFAFGGLNAVLVLGRS